MPNTSTAIIIPSAGRTTHLEKCLNSLDEIRKSISIFPVFVVDNNLDNSMSEKLKLICSRHPDTTYTFCAKPGLSSARHHILGLSSAEVLCFVDDDVIFTHEWFYSIYSTFQDNSISLAGGPSVPCFESSIPSWLWDFFQPTPYGGWACPWLSLLDIGSDIDDIHPNWIWGLNFSIRRNILLECGGFHVDLVPKQLMRWQGDGETGLTMKIASKGHKAVYRQNSLLLHQCGPERLNHSYFAKRAYYQGVCNSFTELRVRLKDQKNNVMPASAKKQIFIVRALRKLKRQLACSLRQKSSPIMQHSTWAASAEEVRKICRKAENDGYFFHQMAAEQDPYLREWICREDYFDIDLRDLWLEYHRSLSTVEATAE